MKRVVAGIVLGLALAAIGFVCVASLAGQFWIPKDAGLAGGAMVFGYGLAGALVGALTGGLVAWRGPAHALVPASVVAIVLAGGMLGGLFWIATNKQEARDNVAEPTRPVSPVN